MGFPVISWRHSLQARSKMKPGCAIGTDGLNAEVVQALSMRGSLLLWCLLNVVAWASTSPKTWTLSPLSLCLSLSLAACLPKDWAMLKVVRHKVDRWRHVCMDATLAKVHKAIRSFRQCTDMILTMQQLTEKSRMWPDRPLAMIELDMPKAFDQLYRGKVVLALAAASEAAPNDRRENNAGRGRGMLSGGPPRTWGTPGQTGICGPLCARARPLCRAACPWCDQNFCVDTGGKPLAAFAYADATGAAWKLTRMVSELTAELARFGVSLSAEIGKCA